MTLASGQPININYLFEDDFNGSGEYFGRPGPRRRSVRGNRRPGQVPQPDGVRGALHARTATGGCAGGQHFGNLPRNAYYGPDFKNVDLSLVKNTRLGGRATLQVRLDTFNVFNHTNFTQPDAAELRDRLPAERHRPGDEPRRRASCRSPRRRMSAAATRFLGGGGPRAFQLAARVTF